MYVGAAGMRTTPATVKTKGKCTVSPAEMTHTLAGIGIARNSFEGAKLLTKETQRM